VSHTLICTWLQLPANSWPPDHYRLLGLEPGEGDLALIEQRVNQRLDAVRPYQMMHPEQATEVMNRLAQAFICLTEPAAKRSYDEQLLGVRPRAVPPPLPPMVPVATPVPEALPGEPREPFAWLGTPVAEGPGGALAPELQPAPPPKPAPPPPVEVPKTDPSQEAAQSPATRHGLSTRRGLYQRVLQTRHLQRLWHSMGKYLDDPERRFTGTDAREFYKLVEEVESAADDFPLIGDPGQPGQYILTLGQFDHSRTLRGLTQGQRELLRTDWQSGLTFLDAHRDFLRTEIGAFRRRGFFGRLRHGLNAAFRDYPLVAYLLLAGAFALAVALARTWYG
jgi:hypothetical protein